MRPRNSFPAPAALPVQLAQEGLGYEPVSPGAMSAIMRVPAGVPSLVQGSPPWMPSSPLKNNLPSNTMRSGLQIIAMAVIARCSCPPDT